jgi:hypothetical protein
MFTSTPAKRLLNRRAVSRRYGDKHSRTIKRWADLGVIPPPDVVINNQGYWDEAKLDHHDRQRVADSKALPK